MALTCPLSSSDVVKLIPVPAVLKNAKKTVRYNLQLFFLNNFPIFAAKKNVIDMTFDKILDNNTLWAVRYEGVADNALQTLFE